jgi:hypothetical protein
MSDAIKKIDEVKDSVVDISVLFNEDTSEETRDKIKTVFEAAVEARSKELLEAEVAKRDELVSEATAKVAAELEEAVDEYLGYVVEKWLEENKIAIESSFKVEMAESLMTGLSTLFAEHNMEIPEDADDVLEGLVARNEDLQAKLNESYKENMALTESLEQAAIGKVVDDLSEGLTDTQVSKLKTLAEGIRYSDVEDFEKKLVAVKETFFKESAKVADPVEDKSGEVVTESVEVAPPPVAKPRPSGDPMVDKINSMF